MITKKLVSEAEETAIIYLLEKIEKTEDEVEIVLNYKACKEVLDEVASGYHIWDTIDVIIFNNKNSFIDYLNEHEQYMGYVHASGFDPQNNIMLGSIEVPLF